MKTIIYTDGSSLGNPGPGGWGAVMVFTSGNVKEIGGEKAETTNNEMELTAIERALVEMTESSGGIAIYSDSKYAIQGITSWSANWQKNNWMTRAKEPVANKEIWQEILKLKKVLEEDGRAITFEHIPGHASHPGNERADDIARGFSEGDPPKLFEGTLENSPLAGADLSVDYDTLKKTKAKRSRSGNAYSYLSLVDGKLEKHAHWSECEARVKGVKGAKFKKALSKEEEKDILKEWSVE